MSGLIAFCHGKLDNGDRLTKYHWQITAIIFLIHSMFVTGSYRGEGVLQKIPQGLLNQFFSKSKTFFHLFYWKRSLEDC